MATELGQAYVQIMPSAKGITGSIKKTLDPESSSAGTSAGNKIASFMKKAITVAAIGKFIGSALTAGGELQQSLGGVETLFKDNADKVKKYANEAYKTAGLSANAYMENVTSFSASLLQSLGGDTEKAADKSNMAMVDMADNSNKMGTSMESIQNAYKGFAKSNYTMLDNLSLGYGGTKGEMERLLADATKLTGVKYDISNLADVYDAIHAVQGELGITGTTALESAETLSGSLASMKASFTDLLGALALGEDIKPALQNLSSTLLTFLKNLLPMVTNIISELPTIIITLLQSAGPDIIGTGAQAIADLVTGLSQSLPILIPIAIDAIMLIVGALLDNLPAIIDAGIELIIGLALGVINALPQLVDKIPIIIEKLVIAIVNNLPTIIQAGVQLIIALAGGLMKAMPQLITSIPKIISALVQGLGKGISSMASVGSNLVKGIWSGISNATGWILDKIKGFGKSVLNGIKGIFGIKSPSTVFRDEVGKNLALGLGEGFTDEMGSVTKVMGNLTDDALNSFNIRNPLNSVIEGLSMKPVYAMAGGVSFDNANDSLMNDIVIQNITTLDGEVIASSTEKINTRNDRRFNPTKK